MAISGAFKGAYTNQVSQQNQTISNEIGGVKAVAGVALTMLGFTSGGGIGGMLQKVARAAGIGGEAMKATLNEKAASGKAKEEAKNKITVEQAKEALGDNPINRSAVKTLDTVFNTLQKAKVEKEKKEKPIETSLGKVDTNSELGKLIKENLEENK